MASLSDMPLAGASLHAEAPLGAGASAKSEKAAWFREVLELEPGSKIFLPFSRLLAELGRGDEAVGVLRDGLDRHPEFIEARLFLIDLLHKSGNSALCGAEVARLASLFREYPGFWDAWSDLSATGGHKPDLTVSLGFLGAIFRNQDVTLVDVLAAGLKNLQGSAGQYAGQSVVQPAQVAVVQPQVLARDPDEGKADSLAPAKVPVFVFGEAGFAAGVDSDAEFSTEEKCSLRTRSMAEVLAEQGDLLGAVDIYEELLAASSAEESAALQSRLDSLRVRLGEEGTPLPAHHASASSQPKAIAAKPQSGVLDLLEKLAVRLETKARQ